MGSTESTAVVGFSDPPRLASLVAGGPTCRTVPSLQAAPGDIELAVEGGARFLKTSESFRAKLCEPLKQTLVLRLIGKKTGGPWIILGHYLVVFSWEPTFRVSDDLLSRMVVWIRFPRLPYQYYNRDILEGLENLVGNIVRPDDRTLNSVRGKFARIAVEMDLSVPAPKGVFVDGHWQVIEYENLPCFCKDCGRFGHEASNCDSRLGVVSPVSAASVSTVVVPCAAVITDDVPTEPEGP
ncbi:hypothetical protein LINGRAHAP2_LOCUS31226 [Linum grandiflorum]